MSLLEHLEKLPDLEVVGRWGIGSVTEVYELEVGPYTIVVLRNERLKVWTAYCRRLDEPAELSLPEHIAVDAETKELVGKALEQKLGAILQSKRENLLTELNLLQTIEDLFEPSIEPRPALERLANEPI